MLPPRLAVILAAIPPELQLIDVGTDHGLLPEAHVRRAGAPSLGIDRSRGALQAAKERLAGAKRQPELVVGDGLTGLSPFRHPTAVVFAGMGGETVASLMRAGAEVVRSARLVIVQANRDEDCSRAAAMALGFGESSTHLVWSGRRLFVTSVFRPLSEGGVPLSCHERITGRVASIEPAGLATILAEARVERLAISTRQAARGGDWRKAEQLARRCHAWRRIPSFFIDPA